jgi:hypothetical protein
MLTMVPPRQAADGPPIDPDNKTAFDWSARLSLDTIRHHTKTDDVPGVTDEQLTLYRAAAIEAAEMYTGMLLAGQKTIIEPVQGPSRPRPGKYTYKHELRYPTADGMVYLYGGQTAADNRKFMVPPGSRVIQVPIVKDYIDLSCPCAPCAQPWALNGGMMAAYKAGFKCADDVPAGIVLGCLQFLAWIVEHPGDELLTQRNRKDNSTKIGGVSGSNNIAMVSGALETWRLYDDSAI